MPLSVQRSGEDKQSLRRNKRDWKGKHSVEGKLLETSSHLQCALRKAEGGDM